MNYLTQKEKKISDEFKKKGYLILKAEKKNSLNYLKNFILNKVKQKKFTSNLNYLQKSITIEKLNDFRLEIINSINNDKKFKYHYFNLARSIIYTLVGNEIMMQKNINLSIQLPNDLSSLLPIHSDVWSGDSPYEINLWVPLVNCYNTKSMYILEQADYEYFKKQINNKKVKSSREIYNIVKKKIRWLKVNYGEFLVFNQSLPHGNIVNKEKETRWSMNCRFKSFFSPYGDKKIGEFFIPIISRAMTDLALNYDFPIKLK
jgi:sporadic carbohydrate cluster 2OG-Fe(II) oxygenase